MPSLMGGRFDTLLRGYDRLPIFCIENFDCICLKENECVMIQISLKLVTRGQIDKQLPEPMMTELIDANMHHQSSMSMYIDTSLDTQTNTPYINHMLTISQVDGVMIDDVIGLAKTTLMVGL